MLQVPPGAQLAAAASSRRSRTNRASGPTVAVTSLHTAGRGVLVGGGFRGGAATQDLGGGARVVGDDHGLETARHDGLLRVGEGEVDFAGDVAIGHIASSSLSA